MVKKNPKRRTKKFQKSQKNRSAIPTQTKTTNQQKTKREAKQQENESIESQIQDTPNITQKVMIHTEKLIAYATVGLFIVTTGLFIVTGGLLYANLRTLRVISNDAMQDKRAWIGHDDSSCTCEANGNISYKIKFTNRGKTPSIETRSYAGVVFDPSLISAFFEEDIPDDPNFSRTPIVPNSFFYVSNKDEVSDELVESVESETTKMFVLVKVQYLDIFNKLHNTHVCMFYNPKKKRLIPYHKYNRMD